MKIKEALIDESVSYRDFHSALMDQGIGYWDNVNSTDTIQSYIQDMIKEGVRVSHILEAIEQNDSEFDDWKIWLGNSMLTPEPINSKEALLEALGLEDHELETELTIKN